MSTPWDKKKLAARATGRGENRYRLFKADQRRREEEQERLQESVQADQRGGYLRAFLGGGGAASRTAKTNSRPERRGRPCSSCPLTGRSRSSFSR